MIFGMRDECAEPVKKIIEKLNSKTFASLVMMNRNSIQELFNMICYFRNTLITHITLKYDWVPGSWSNPYELHPFVVENRELHDVQKDEQRRLLVSYVAEIKNVARRLINLSDSKLDIWSRDREVIFKIYQIRLLNKRRKKLFQSRLSQLIRKIKTQNELLACIPRNNFPGGMDYLKLIEKYKAADI